MLVGADSPYTWALVDRVAEPESVTSLTFGQPTVFLGLGVGVPGVMAAAIAGTTFCA